MLKAWRELIFGPKRTEKLVKTETQLIERLCSVIPSFLSNDDVVFLCIGSNQVSGDCFGPLVGSYLQRNGYKNVYGTIDRPIDARNLAKLKEELPKNKAIIAIDAALGTFSVVGSFSVVDGPLYPGAGVGKSLPPTGDFAIMGVVNMKNWKNDTVSLSHTRLSILVSMVTILAKSLMKRFPVAKAHYVNAFEDHEIQAFLQRVSRDFSPILP